MNPKIWLMRLRISKVKLEYSVGMLSLRLSAEMDSSLTAVQLLLNTFGGLETKTLEKRLKTLERRRGIYKKLRS